MSVCWNWALGSGMRPSYPSNSLPLTLGDLSLSLSHTHTHTHTHSHTPPPQGGGPVPSQLAGRGHDTRLSQRFDQKESQRLEAPNAVRRDSLPLLSLSSSLSNALNQCSPAQDTLKHWILDEIKALFVRGKFYEVTHGKPSVVQRDPEDAYQINMQKLAGLQCCCLEYFKNTESSEEQLLPHSGSKNTAFERAGGHGSHEKSSYSNPTPMPLSERCYVRWLWRSCLTSDLSLLCAHRGAGTSPRRSKDRCVQKPSEGKRDNAKSDPNPNPNPNPGICRTANGLINTRNRVRTLERINKVQQISVPVCSARVCARTSHRQSAIDQSSPH
ncbi:hypothetical protein QQF64_012852 [Cirrhinus molitorella]|uniref:Uncharacterized protein n=1 Tax=Cirrhinus molitorella TaxID=172907 RepID=A0ABR3M099_9TELE